MRDAFYEESASSQHAAAESKKYMVFHVTGIICIVAAAIHAFFSITFVPAIIGEAEDTLTRVLSLVQWFAPFLLLVGGWLLAWWWKKRYNVSYDYVFVEDELRISKVFNGKKRKFLVKLTADSILKLGLCDNDSYERTISGREKSVCRMTPNKTPSEGKMFIYVVNSGAIDKTVYVLECREQLLGHLVQAAGRNKLELK